MRVLVTGNLGYIGTVFDADAGSGWARGGRFGQRPLFTLYIFGWRGNPRGDVLFRDSIAPPLAGPVVEVCAIAKRDLKAGEILDDYGMYMTYGEAVNVDEMSLPAPEGHCRRESRVGSFGRQSAQRKKTSFGSLPIDRPKHYKDPSSVSILSRPGQAMGISGPSPR